MSFRLIQNLLLLTFARLCGSLPSRHWVLKQEIAGAAELFSGPGDLVVMETIVYAAEGCQPASAQSSPVTAEFEIMKQIASAISSGLIKRPN